MAAQKLDPLDSWVALNKQLLGMSEKAAAELLEREKSSRRRRRFLLRIHSRLNKLRAHRERAQLTKLSLAA